MHDDRTKLAYGIAIAGGAILWVAAARTSGRTEAWDSSLYWTVAYPLGICLAAALGYAFPERPWRWGLSLMLVQPVVLACSGSGFGLLPLGLMVFALLALPAIASARIGARFRLRGEDA